MLYTKSKTSLKMNPVCLLEQKSIQDLLLSGGNAADSELETWLVFNRLLAPLCVVNAVFVNSLLSFCLSASKDALSVVS